VEFYPEVRNISPDMMENAYDVVYPKSTENVPSAPPAPPIPTDLPPHTEQGQPNSLLDQIKRGKSLKHTETKESENRFKGKEVNRVASSSSISLASSLKKQLDKIRPMITGEEEEVIKEDIGA
jgi:hypothetical protein